MKKLLFFLITLMFATTIGWADNAPITTVVSVSNACPGSISVPVQVSAFNNIGAISLTLNYDATKLTFVTGNNTSGYPGMTFGNPTPGTVYIGAFSYAGVSLLDNATLFTLDFTYVGCATSTALTWYDDGISCEYAGPGGTPILNDSPQSTYYIGGTVTKDGIAPVLAAPPAAATYACISLVPVPGNLGWTDNCDGSGTVLGVDVSNGLTCPETITRTWSYTDACGNPASVSQTITVDDNIAPVFTAPPAAATYACISLVPVPGNLGWTDNCDGSGTVLGVDVSDGLTCPETITRTWSYTDACGNPASVSQTITVDDNIAPVFTAPPAAATYACISLVPVPGNLGWTDNCDGSGTVLGVDVSDGLTCPETITRTWSYTDACGNPASVSQTITVDDNIAPVFAAPPAAATYACISLVPVPGNLGWTDNCDGSGTVLGVDVSDGLTCPETITRTWSYTDACGNPASVSQTITVDDNIAPVFTAPPAAATYACISLVPVPGNLGWTDNCDGSGTVLGVDVSDGLTCPETITRTWSYTDACGNPASVSQTITVDDNIAPVFAAPPADVTVDCIGNVPAMTSLGWTDNCDGSGSVVGSDGALQGGTCGGTITRTWSYTDACGNPATATQIITVDDNTPPEWIAPIFRRDMPLANVNNAAGANRSNVAWADGVLSTEYYGDDFKLGPSIDGYWTINKVVVWGVAGYESDPDFDLLDYFSDISLYSANAPKDPWTAPFDWSATQGQVQMNTISTGIFGANNTVTTSDGTVISIVEVKYYNGQSYQGGSGTFRRIWKVTFDNLNWTVPAMQLITYGVNCTHNFPADVTKRWFNHFSNYTLSLGSTPPWTAWDGLNLDFSPVPAPLTDIYAIDNSLPGGGWDKQNDHNVLIYGIQSCSIAYNSCLSGAPAGPSAEDIAALFTDNCGEPVTAIKLPPVINGNDCDWNVKYVYEVRDACGNLKEPLPTVNYHGGDKTPPVWTTVTSFFDVFLDCDDVAGLAEAQAFVPVATDNCGGILVPVKTAGALVSNPLCPQAGTYTNTWTVSDACGNAVANVYTQVITILDNTAPVPLAAVINRPMPTQNVNSSPNRCNVTWADGADPDIFYGDDFKFDAGTGNWNIKKIVLWGTAGPSTDLDFKLEDYFNSISLYVGNAPVDPWNSPNTFQGASLMDPPVMTGTFYPGSNLTNNPNILIEKVTYYNGEYYQGNSGAFRYIWKVTFKNLNITVPGGQKIIYGANCVQKNPSLTDERWYNHFSNEVLGGQPFTQGDGLFVDFEALTNPPNRDIWILDPVLGGWNNVLNDGNVEVYAVRASESTTGINACKPTEIGPTVSQVEALYGDDCGTFSVVKAGTVNGDNCAWNVTYTYTIADNCGNTVTPAPTMSFSGGNTIPPVVPAPGASTISCASEAVPPLPLVQSNYSEYDLAFRTYMNSALPDINQPLNDNWILTQNTGVGQSFTPTATEKLTQIDFNVYTYTSPLNFMVEVYQGNGKIGSPLYSAPGYSVSGTGWVSLTIPTASAPTLTAGQQYTFWLTPYPYNYLQVWIQSGNPYADGEAWDELPGTSTVLDACGTVIPTPIPTISGTYNGCEGTIIYTYTYSNCAGVSSDWVYTYTVDYSGGLTAPANGASTIYSPVGAVNPGAPAPILDACGRTVNPVLIGSVSTPDPIDCDGTVVWTYRYTACDLTTTADWTYTYTIAKSTINGTLNYYNGASTAMNNVTVTLTKGATVLTTTTDGSGAYSFFDVCFGTYNVEFSTETKPVGGINATDAAQANAWGVGPTYPSIEKVKFFAGDVNNDNWLLSADAGMILGYFVNGGNPAFIPKWTFWKTNDFTAAQNPLPNVLNIAVGAGSPLTPSYYAMASGDFNGSFTPGILKAESGSITLDYAQTMQVITNTEFELPINAGMDMEVGAVSLILNFPSDNVEITGVFLSSDPNSTLLYNVSGDELRIGWNTLAPVWLNEGESLITLKMKVNEPTANGSIYFSLAGDPLNELADKNYEVIGNAVLTIDVVKTSALGFGENSLAENLTLSNHPNPFNGTTTFVYSLPVDGKVILEIFDLVGNKVKVAVDETQSAGTYSLKLDANQLQPGVYTATLKLKNTGTAITRTIKIISK